jgi:D-amino peptidase
MKLLISADMEGISGVVDWKHVNSREGEYQRFRKIMTEDVNAAVRGAFKAGVDEMVVSDAHGSKTNILIENLDDRALLNSGATSPLSMIQGIDDGVDAAIFIGYHACNGTQNAILAHTVSGAQVANVWLNDRLVGEFGMNGAVCGHFGVPVLMVSSDLAGCLEADAWVPGIETVVVKKANSRLSAECLPPSVVQAKIEESTERALVRFKDGGAPEPLMVSAPIRVVLEFTNMVMADKASGMPGVRRLDGRRIEMVSLDMLTAYRTFRAALGVGRP